MKLLKTDGWVHKTAIYDVYQRLIDRTKIFSKITRKIMLEEIIKLYHEEHFLFGLLTDDELQFLDIISKRRKDIKENNYSLYRDYPWEIHQLQQKLIIDPEQLRVYEELEEPVADALAEFREDTREGEKALLTLALGLLRTYVNLPKHVLLSLIASLGQMPDSRAQKLMQLPLVKFYSIEYLDKTETDEPIEMLCYADYYFDSEIYDEVKKRRKQYAINRGGIDFNPDTYVDIFYCGVPRDKPSVEALYQALDKYIYAESVFQYLDEARLTYQKKYLDQALELFEPADCKRLKEVLVAAWEDLPSPVLNGASPKEYRQIVKENEAIQAYFKIVPQENAHLSPEEAEYFYEVYFALLDYVNKTRHINPKVKTIYRQDLVDLTELTVIEKFLWSHKKCIDRFVKENPYDFAETSLNVVRGFKNAVSSDLFAIVGGEKDYTKIYDDNTKRIYMVKGIRNNLSDSIPMERLPIPIGMTLFNFKDNIVFSNSSMLYGIDLGISWKKMIMKGMKKAKVCYKIPEGN